MEFSARQLADLLGGEIEGNPDCKVNTLSKIEEGTAGSLAFLSNPVYEPYLYKTKASVVILNKDFKPEKEVSKSLTILRVKDSRVAFGKLLEMYQQALLPKPGIEQPSFIATSAKVGEGVYIGAFAYIGENAKIGRNVRIFPNVFIGANAIIGDNTILYSGVKVYHECVIGKDCTLHAGVVIGGDGFGFAPNNEENYKLQQIGNVIIEDAVEIGCNTTIDRATLGSTIIRRGAKLDNLIQIGHNAEIGENTMIVSQTGIAGSTKIGKNCIIAGQVGIVGHITIADGTMIAAQSGVGASITEPNTKVQGSPAFSIGDYKRSYVVFRSLPELQRTIKDLEKMLAEFKQIELGGNK